MHGSALVKAAVTGAMLVGMLVAVPAQAERNIASVLFVSKSENKNQVHYGVRLDSECAFLGGAPVYAYWRMLEHSPSATEPLLSREQAAYGIARQEVHSDTVRVTLTALPSRPITVRVTRSEDGTCTARPEMNISGTRARLLNVHVVLGFLRVSHLVVTGLASDGTVVSERISP